MTDFIDKLLRSTFPAVTIEIWTGNDGWPLFRVFLATGPDADRQLLGEDENIARAHRIAKAASRANGDCPIIEDDRV